VKKFIDFQHIEIFLSEESEAHIHFAHPEITLEQITNTLADPDEVRKIQSGKEAKLYYQLKTKVLDGVRYICVVVKITANHEELIVSAMTTSGIKDGEVIFMKEK
jgi:hypothetical protein